jgi:hypothetical protein
MRLGCIGKRELASLVLLLEMIERCGLQEPPQCEHGADYISVQDLATFSQANCRRRKEISDISLKMLISLQVWKEMHA